MPGHRIFYVNQGSLSVWQSDHGGLVNIEEFSDDDAGLVDFDTYLALNADQMSVMVIDVIEEEFAAESVPKLGVRDRKILLENRSKRKFRRTPYRTVIYHGKSDRNNREHEAIYSAISNNELVDPWILIILRHQTPLSGVHSVPMMAPRVFKKLFAVAGTAMFVAPHQGSKLRQVFFRNGKLQGARLSQCPGVADGEYAQSVVSEAMHSRRYLERNRLLGPLESFKVCVIADDVTASRISDLSQSDETTEYRFIDPVEAARKLGRPYAVDPIAAARKLGQPSDATPAHFETLYLSLASHRRPEHSYARSGENRYWKMHRIRDVLIGGAVAMAAFSTVFAAILLSDAWLLRNRISGIQLQVALLEETYRRENEKFNPIRADSHEMKLAVDTGKFILANRVPVPWVMNQLSVVLGDYPDIQVSELRWRAELPAVEGTQNRRRSDAPVSVAVPALRSVSAEITAHIVSFDGDMRRAFARIDALVADFESRTNFNRAIVVEYPFDASTSSAISGEIIQQRGTNAAIFRVRVTYDIPEDGVGPVGSDDESI